jgi:hypothetical protein
VGSSPTCPTIFETVMKPACEWRFDSSLGCLAYRIGNWTVTLEPRPPHCDRGKWIGKVFGLDDIDQGDAFPRYYMDEERAKLELSTWLHHRLKY